MSVNNTVVFKTWLKDDPAASNIAPKFFSACSVCSSMPSPIKFLVYSAHIFCWRIGRYCTLPIILSPSLVPLVIQRLMQPDITVDKTQFTWRKRFRVQLAHPRHQRDLPGHI